MELESHYNDYIESYISYLSMMHTIYSIFTQGITYFFLVSAINTIWSMITDIYVIKSWYCFIYRLRRFCILLSLQCYLFCIMLLFMWLYLVIYCPFDPLVAELNITELSSTQLSAFMHIKTILDKMGPLPDQTSNLRLEDIGSEIDNEEYDFQVLLVFSNMSFQFT